MNFPGVGSYNPNDIITKKKALNYSFGKTKRFQSMEVKYNQKSGFSSRNSSLGPGSYNPKLSSTNAGRFKFGKAARNIGMLNCSNIPGPGSYQNNLLNISNSKKGFSFDKTKKFKSYNNKNKLGPGEYNPKSQTFRNRYGYISKIDKGKENKNISSVGYYNLPNAFPNLSMYNYAPYKNK